MVSGIGRPWPPLDNKLGPEQQAAEGLPPV